ncbi:hypothetical protein MTR67_030156, partial [Solanum verrucosum]
KSKKQSVVARSSTEAEYRAIVVATRELVWIKQLLRELKVEEIDRMELVCDNRTHFHLASIQYFMRGLRTLRLIATLSKKDNVKRYYYKICEVE